MFIGTGNITVTWKNRLRANAPEGRIVTQDEANHDMTGTNLSVVVNFNWLNYSITRQKTVALNGTTTTYTHAEMKTDLGIYFISDLVAEPLSIQVLMWDYSGARASDPWEIQVNISATA
jgi:hypothetical protein